MHVFDGVFFSTVFESESNQLHEFMVNALQMCIRKIRNGVPSENLCFDFKFVF